MNRAELSVVRRVGPTAWVVLETIRHRRGPGGHCAVTIRELAADLGLAKNTVHRAVQRLRQAGLVEQHQARSTAGTFTGGHYELADATAQVVAPAASHRPATPLSQPSATHAASADDGQLTLGI